MNGTSWANLLMDIASIPSSGTDSDSEDKEIDMDNLHKYLNGN